MRVATRRQRAAWRVFGASFRPGRTKRYRNGPARDRRRASGPSATSTSCSRRPTHYRADLPVTEQRALEPLLARLADAPRRRPGAPAAASSIRTATGAGSTTTATSSGPRARRVLPVGPTEPHRVRDTAPSRIWAAYEQVRGYEPVLRWADVETLHELRIAGKWLRYTLEFVREALGAGRRRRSSPG